MVNKIRLAYAIKALRSGGWPQSRHQLQTPPDNPEGRTSYCCLGVLTEIAILCDPTVATQVLAEQHHWWGERGTLPQSVKEWYGFSRSNPFLSIEGLGKIQWCSATEANDTNRLPFSEIADAFEHTYIRSEGDVND